MPEKALLTLMLISGLLLLVGVVGSFFRGDYNSILFLITGLILSVFAIIYSIKYIFLISNI